MGDEERKVVGEIVASGLSVAGWCAATGRMGTTKAYRILNWFRENDPSAFGAGEEAAREPGGGAKRRPLATAVGLALDGIAVKGSSCRSHRPDKVPP